MYSAERCRKAMRMFADVPVSGASRRSESSSLDSSSSEAETAHSQCSLSPAETGSTDGNCRPLAWEVEVEAGWSGLSAPSSSSSSASAATTPPAKRAASAPMLQCFASQRMHRSPMPARAVRLRTSFDLGPMPPAPPPACAPSKALLGSWGVNFTSFNTEQMIQMCHDMFASSGVVDHFDLNPATLSSFFAAVASRYRDIPYHNLNHAVHVLHGTWMVLQCPSAACLLSWKDRLSLLVAALVHDLDHDGHSNSYHTHTHSDLAKQYDNRSVMENHHIAVALEVMGKENCALLEGMDCDVAARLRQSITDIVLGTDMANHFSMTRDFCLHPPRFDPTSESDRRLLRAVIVHAADIGAAARPYNINDVLSKRIHREFHILANEETELGIPVTLAVDSDDPVSRAIVEVGFLDFIVLPLWEKLATVVPELEPALAAIKCNRELYSALAGAGKSDMASEETGPT